MASILGGKRRCAASMMRRKCVDGWEFDARNVCDALNIDDDDFETADERDTAIWSLLATLVEQECCVYVGDGSGGECSACHGRMMPDDKFCAKCGAEVVRKAESWE